MSDHQPDLNFTPPEDEKLSYEVWETHNGKVTSVRAFVPPMNSQAHARKTDPAHSFSAAKSVRNIEKVRANIRFIIEQHGPLTDEEIAAHYALGFEPKSSPSGLRTRRNELVADNEVRASTRTGRTAANRACGVWEIVR